MTRTCGPCNNRLGSLVEGDLVDWHDRALNLPRFSGEAVPGSRRSSRILYRITPEGEPVLLLDGEADQAVNELLLGGTVNLASYFPDFNRVRIGLLKHAFLAACLYFGTLGHEADGVRQDLIAARDTGSRDAVPRSDLALRLTVLRAAQGPVLNWPVVHCVAKTENGDVQGVMLAGTTFVSWESDPRPRSQEAQPIRTTITVDGPLDGVVRTVNGP